MPGQLLQAHAKAQKKMHCTLQHIRANTQEASERRNLTLQQNSIEQNTNFHQDQEVSSLVWGNSDNSCGYMTFLMLESEQWRIVALPLRCANHSNHWGSRDQVKMSLPVITSFSGGQPKVLRRNADRSCPDKSYAVRSSAGANRQHHSQNRTLEDKAVKYSVNARSRSRNSVTCSDISDFIPAVPNPTSSSTNSKALKRKSRKKGRKKGKQNKKLSCDTGPAELDIFSEERAYGSSNSETYANNDMEQDEQALHATAPVISLSDFIVDKNEHEGNSKGTIDCPDMLSTCSSLIDGEEVSDTTVPFEDERFTQEHFVLKSEDSIQTIEPEGTEGTYSAQISCSNDVHSEAYHDRQDSFLPDTVSVSWDNNDSSTTVYECNDENNDITLSEAPASIGTEDCTTCQSSSSLLGVMDSHSDEKLFGGTGGSICDPQFFVNGKSGKQVRLIPKNSSVFRFSNTNNLYDRMGKENNHSVRQKIQRSDTDEPKHEHQVQKVNPCPEFDITLKEALLLKRNCNFVDSDFSSKSKDVNRLKVEVSRKSRRKTSPGSKQNCYSGKGSHLVKDIANPFAKLSKQNGRFNSSAQVNDKRGLGSDAGYRPQSSCSRVGLHTHKVECLSSKPVQDSQVHPLNLQLHDVQTAETQSCSSSKIPYANQSIYLQEPYQVRIPDVKGKGVAEVKKEVPLAQNTVPDNNSGSVLQKWIPVGIKDPGPTSSQRSDSSMVVLCNESSGEGGNSHVISERGLPPNPAPSFNEVTYRIQNSGEVHCSPQEGKGQNCKWKSVNASAPVEGNVAANGFTCDFKNNQILSFKNDSRKIALAINDVCRVQLESEAVQMATGSPIAEFERFLYSASPVVSQSNCPRSCQTCSRDQVAGATLCRHETPVRLGSMWKWYDKHGSYGLEVRGDEYKSSHRMGSDRFAFRAYFVPYLSSVQLFRNHKRDSKHNGSGIPEPEVPEACEMAKDSGNSSSIIRCPILSVLVPKPYTDNTSFLPLVNEACNSVTFVRPAEEGTPLNFVDTTRSEDFELLFEYFEVDQPQQRRPLFDKIKELIKTGISHKAYGDPASLASTDIRDLHPRSWYSVAWYPIYRIPDGNFRAAFLTYHSLGHMVRRSVKIDSASKETCIVSPVVGLQSYNAKDESWFQLRHTETSQNTEIPSSNPSEILKERLRTLEQTATLMARASVRKEDLTSVSRHPDFEFFTSRRH